MITRSFQTAMTLYRSGTLTRSQAARQAGCSDAAMGRRTRSLRARIDEGPPRGGRSADAV